MALQITVQHVLEMAPDASSAKAGQGLARPDKWKGLGHSERAVWGEIQGSGKSPYQTRVDLDSFSTKCSCPSRKFPCKHALGLLLVLAEKPKAFAQADPPGWVSEWIADRDKRQEKKAEKDTTKRGTIADPAARQRRIQSRQEKILGGLDELQLWLIDLVRRGLGAAQSQPTTFWESMAARMVDAQAPGLARLVRDMAAITVSGDGWQDRLLTAVGRLYLLMESYRRLDRLDPETQADVRSLIGWTLTQEELLAFPTVRDEWTTVGQSVESEDRLRVQRTWLCGRHQKRMALILQFAAGTQPFSETFLAGKSIDADVIYYPGACPLRATIGTRHGEPKDIGDLQGIGRIGDALRAHARDLASNPWIERWPMALADVVPEPDTSSKATDRWFVRDVDGVCVPTDAEGNMGWQLLAISGGRPLSVFGEWNGDTLRLESVASEGRFFAVTGGELTSVLARVC